jgi:hypothetical protein
VSPSKKRSQKAAGRKPTPKGDVGDGARSPNRPVATSAQEQDRPVSAPRSAPKAAAVAAAELRRAAGKAPQSPADAPAADAIGLPWAQAGDRLTTASGLRVDDADSSLKAGERGPTLLEDHHLREKIMHFDHERIPERAVHARGAGAHGTFVATEGAEDLCAAAFLRKGAQTPVFTRFSTVAGSRGSADTARDVRGFATKFYTSEGNFDLVGNNIPIFFIQDGLKFPDLIHAVKPEPDREIPQAQSAHDTFWDFVSLQPESTHMLLWVMSDRAIPRSYEQCRQLADCARGLQGTPERAAVHHVDQVPVARLLVGGAGEGPRVPVSRPGVHRLEERRLGGRRGRLAHLCARLVDGRTGARKNASRARSKCARTDRVSTGGPPHPSSCDR